MGTPPVTRTQTIVTEHREQMEVLYDASAGRVIPLKNIQNMSYLGPVYFTDSFQGADAPYSEFVYDTGSGDLTVTSKKCTEGCKT